MASKPVEVLKQLGAFWSGLSNTKRIALALAVACVMVGVTAIAVVGSRIEYAYLYTDIDAKEAGSIVQKLESLQVPYKVEASGTAIRVPAEQVHALRATLAKEGLPSRGGVGNELFDQSRLGATEFEQEVNLRRALEGELSRSILEIAGVSAARVHLVIPKRRLFAAKSEGAQASVVLTLRNNVDFGRNEVAAIVHLVTMAVPNLTPDRVTVVDSKGTTLHRPDAGKDGLGISEERAMEMREQELRLAERTQSLLEKVAGPGAVEVRIKLDFDSAAREQTKEQYDPTVTALRSENKVEERTNTEGATVAGIPGAQTNLPDLEPAVQPTETEQGGNFTRRSHIRNWEVDRIVEKLSRPAGDVLRVSVGVLVDGRYEMREGQEVYVPRSAEELEMLRNVVKGAVGFDAKRGDTIELQSTRFYRDTPEAQTPVVDADPKWLKYVVPASAGLGVLLLMSSLVLVWRKRKREALEKQAALEAALYGDQNAQLPDGEPRLLQPGEEVDEDGTPLYTPEFFQQRKATAIQIASSDPATAAIVLREWLASAGTPNPQGAAANEG